MNPTIKARIESIRRGEVPEGYKRTKAGIMPVPWCKEKTYQAKDLFVSVSDKKHGGTMEVLSATQDRGIVPRRLVDIDIKYDDSNLGTYKKVDKGDFVISLRSFQGGIEYSDYVGIVSPAYTVVRSKQKIVSGYYKAYFKTEDFIKRLNIGTYGIRDGKQVSFDDFGDMVLHYPPVNEQEKIAEILAGQDRVVELKEKLLAEKQKQKKYLMQQLLTGKKRLPGFSDEWKNIELGKCLKSKNQKELPSYKAPLMAFVADKGIVPKGNKYDRSFLVKNLDKQYKRTDYNDFIYSSNNLDVGSIGLNLFGSAVISEVYEVFCVLNGYVPMIVSKIIKLPKNINKIIRFRQGVIYGQYRIYAEDFLSVIVSMPCFEEQIAIAEILSTADKEIELLKKDIEQEKLKKKSLMQLLLTGIVRVKDV